MSKRRKPTTKRPSLNSRQTTLVKELAKGKTLKDAGIAAGYSEKTARQGAHQALEGIRAKMPEVLDRHGLTDDALINKYLLPLLNAKTTKHFAHQGKVKDTRHYADNTTRRETLDMAFKLKGAYAPKTEEEAHISQQFMGPTVLILDIPRPKRPESPSNE